MSPGTWFVGSFKLIGDGRRQINGFYLPGDLFDFERGDMHRLTAEAIVDTKGIMFRRRQLERLATTDVDVACQLWSMTAKSLQHAEAHMLLLGRRTALERVATFLMEMDSRLGHTGSIELSMSRRDIADYLGLTLETVSRFDVPAAEPTCGRTCGSAPPRSRQRDDEDAGRRLMDSA